MNYAAVRQVMHDLRERRPPFVFLTPAQGELADRVAADLEELLWHRCSICGVPVVFEPHIDCAIPAHPSYFRRSQ